MDASQKLLDFSGKVVLVTGASSGIGAATVALFAAHGAKLSITARREELLREVAGKCGRGAEVLVTVGDVTNGEDLKRILNETIDKYGRLDVLINNAGLLRKVS